MSKKFYKKTEPQKQYKDYLKRKEKKRKEKKREENGEKMTKQKIESLVNVTTDLLVSSLQLPKTETRLHTKSLQLHDFSF